MAYSVLDPYTSETRMGTLVILEWTFSPPDYFEEPIKITREDYKMTIANGQARAEVDAVIFDATSNMRDELHRALNDRFLGVQLLSYKRYELAHPTMSRLHPDGRRDYFLIAAAGAIAVTGATLDFKVTDKDGNVLRDSKRDRIEKKKQLASRVAAHRANSPRLESMLLSYGAAIRDPTNELVHLYEIRDALVAELKSATNAKAMLDISNANWSRFGELCNDAPVRQGRHRGKTGTALRDASDIELQEARKIAREMIEAFLTHLDSQTPS